MASAVGSVVGGMVGNAVAFFCTGVVDKVGSFPIEVDGELCITPDFGGDPSRFTSCFDVGGSKGTVSESAELFSSIFIS